jgi:hypothetical protein
MNIDFDVVVSFTMPRVALGDSDVTTPESIPIVNGHEFMPGMLAFRQHAFRPIYFD